MKIQIVFNTLINIVIGEITHHTRLALYSFGM